MRQLFYIFVIILFQQNLIAQKEFHVFSKNDKITPGGPSGNGSLAAPWDLQTALSQKPQTVNGGDIIWLHEGVYEGAFLSTLQSTLADKFIIVSAYKNDKVVLNGNVKSSRNNVLQVKGSQVIFKNFEITCLGEFSRNEKDVGFKRINGLDHASGQDCKFINVIIHNVPGLGFGSWKNTGGTVIENCIIYNNGYISKKGRGTAEGIYVQNSSNKIRVIRNNVIFNNYYKGIEVWSANKRAKDEYVKNVLIENNIIFNNGSPSGVFKDNLIIASDDRNGINVAKNIKVIDNIFYHNTNVLKNEIGGNAASLTLGFHPNAPIENVEVTNNIIIGRNNALRILHAKSLIFKNNITYAGYIHFYNSVLPHLTNGNWNFDNNTYHTKNANAFRVLKHRDYNFNQWQSNFKIDANSEVKHLNAFNLDPVLSISKFSDKANKYRIALFEKNGNDVSVDFSRYRIPIGSTYRIYDVENRKHILKSGVLKKDLKIFVPMNDLSFEKPLHNLKAQKTLNNFGVYLIEFEGDEKKKRKTFFGKLFSSIFG